MSWGSMSIILHWLTALFTFTLFFLGLWMVSLSYYEDWYKLAPHWHKSLGVIFSIVLLARLFWRCFNAPPTPIGDRFWEKKSARAVHFLLYCLLLSMVLTGYLVATIDGDKLSVFNWFSIPSLIYDEGALEDFAEFAHQWIAYTIMALVVLHIIGALKHHYVDRDETLLRMLGRRAQHKKEQE